ncbi:hypothetical protein D3C81_2009650 [compost metagenome]
MVVDHVQYQFQPGRVQARDHLLELGHGAGGHVARLRGEEANGVVAPVVAQAAVEQLRVVDVGMHWQ